MTDASQVVALVLAAGSARRYGSDKRQAKLANGRSLLATSVDNARRVFDDVRVVLRPEDDAANLGLPADCAIVRSTRSDEGMAHSLAAGVAMLESTGALAVAVLLGDMPSIDSTTLHELTRHSTADTIVLPCYAGKRGHPVLFGRNFWPQLQALQGDTGGRDLLRRHAMQVVEVAVSDSGIHLDIDEPAGLDALPTE